MSAERKNEFASRSGSRVTCWGKLLGVFCVALTVSLSSGEFQSGGTLALHKILLHLDTAAIESLRVRPRKNVNGRIELDGVRLENVRVHLKGHASFQPIDQKPSFTLTVEDSGTGISKKIHLNNSAEDPSYLNELVGTDLFRAAGLVAPDVGHALVELNGRKLGVFVWKEGWEECAGAAGTIYEPRADGEIVSKSSGSLELSQCSERVDKEAFRTFVAVELLVVHRDGYALAANNFRIYGNSGHLVFLPAGMDQLFGKADYPLKPKFGGDLAHTFFASASEREKLEARMRELLPLLAPARLHRRIDSVLAELRPVLGRREFNEMHAAADDLKERIARRYEFLEQNVGTTVEQGVRVAERNKNEETR